jgi:hypothetical protein
MKIMMTICAAAIGICGTLGAQSAASVDRVKVHFSTPVEVGGATIAAGDCTIQVLRGSSDSVLLALRPESGRTVSVQVNRVSEPLGDTHTAGSAQVILSRHGNDYRLERVLMPDHSGFAVFGGVE